MTNTPPHARCCDAGTAAWPDSCPWHSDDLNPAPPDPTLIADDNAIRAALDLPATFPPKGHQLIDVHRILDALDGYTITNASQAPDRPDSSQNLRPGPIVLQLQAPELPDLTLRIDGGLWTATTST